MGFIVSDFAYIGQLPASKSILNRLLIARTYSPDLKIVGSSLADDVVVMDQALNDLSLGKAEFEMGKSATGFRLLAMRLSRLSGQFKISAHESLFERPMNELLKVLFQLGVETELSGNSIEIQSQGWRMHGDMLLVPFARSSQFATAVLMNAWNLPFDLFVSLGGQKVSEGYWRMSLQIAKDLGMQVDAWDGDVRIPKNQQITTAEFKAETDVSSAFSLACVAAVSGDLSIVEFPETHLQPDVAFLEIFEKMGIPLRLTSGTLKVDKAEVLKGVQVDLKNHPDLFPCLVVLCGLAKGDSHLYGAPHLVFKESNRLEEMVNWLKLMGRDVISNDDGVMISGDPVTPRAEPLKLSAKGDHRLAFAAAVLKAAGWRVELDDSKVVSKSFPEFWQILGWSI